MNEIAGMTTTLPILLTASVSFSVLLMTAEGKSPKGTSLTARLFRRRSRNEEQLTSEILCGLDSVLSRSRYFRNQIQLLRTVIRQNVSRAHPLEETKVKKFNENSRNIDLLSINYTILYSHLNELFEHENEITSPDILWEHRQKEVETLRQLSALSDQIEPLLSENEQIAAYVVKFTDEEGASA